ncbi:MAG: HAD-IB family phosphatase [Waddliaceae bacterium]|nr:HAD-IB family phosphatase [Waddliaceae bacterium]
MKKLSVFDLDHTLLSLNASYRFGAYLYRNKEISLFSMLYLVWYYIRHKAFGMSLRELHDAVFKRMLIGKSLAAIVKYVDPFLDKILPKTLYKPAVDRLRTAQKENHIVYLISNSPAFIVGKIAERLEIKRWRATTYGLDQQGKLCGVECIWEGDDKADFVKKVSREENIAKENITVYTDSIIDVPLLEIAGQPVAVNPDKPLKALASKKGWEIL